MIIKIRYNPKRVVRFNPLEGEVYLTIPDRLELDDFVFINSYESLDIPLTAEVLSSKVVYLGPRGGIIVV